MSVHESIMKTVRSSGAKRSVCFAVMATVAAAVPTVHAATKTYVNAQTNFAASTSWTAAGAPGAADDAVFTAAIAGGTTVTSTLSDNLTVGTINSLRFTTGGSPSSNTMLFILNLNAPLLINNTSTVANVDVLTALNGRNTAASTGQIQGTSSLTVISTIGQIRLNNDANSTGTAGGGTLDMSNLASFNANVNQITLGYDNNGTFRQQYNNTLLALPTGLVNGTGTSNVTANLITLGAGSRSGTGATITLGKVNVFNVDTILIGGAGGNVGNGATIRYNNSTSTFAGSLVLAGKTGALTNLTIGQNSNAATFDLTTNAAASGTSLAINNLIVGQGGGAALFNFGSTSAVDSNVMTANTVTINTSGSSTGTFNINGGTVTATGSAVSIGAGTILVTGNGIFHTAGINPNNNASTTNVTVSGNGTLNLHGGDIGTTSAAITNFTYSGGSVTNVGNVYAGRMQGGGTSVHTLSLGAGKLSLNAAGASNAANVAVTLNGGTLNMNNTSSADTLTLQGLNLTTSTLNLDVTTGIIDNINVTGTDTLLLTGVSTINLTSYNGTVTPTSRHIITYAGTTFDAASHFNLGTYTAPSGLTFSLFNNGNSVDLAVTPSNTWKGQAGDNNWNVNPNWTGGTAINGQGTAATFLDGSVRHDVNVDAPVTVGSLTIDSVTSYSFAGSSITLEDDTTNVASLIANTSAHTISAPLNFVSPTTLNISSTLTLPTANQLTGGVLLTKIGAGTLIINAAQSYSGGLTISAGTVRLGDANALSGNIITMSGGTLDLNNLNVTLGNLLVGASGNVNLNTSSTLTLGSDIGDHTYGGNIIGTGTVIKAGSDVTTLTGTSSFVGTLQITNGVVAINKDLALGAATNAVNFTADSTLRPTVAFATAATRTISINNGVTGTIDTNVAFTYAGTIGGLGSLKKTGTGALTLSGTNNYSGATTVGGGQLRGVDGTNVPTTSNVVLDGGTWESSSDITRALGTAANQVQFGGTGLGGFSAITNPINVNLGGSGATLTWGLSSGMTNLQSLTLNDTTANNTLNFVNPINLNGQNAIVSVAANTATLSGLLNDTSGNPQSFTKGGAGTLVVANFNYSGTINVSAGTLRPSAIAPLQHSNVNLSGGTIDLAGFANTTFAGLFGTGGLDLKGTQLVLGGDNTDSQYAGAFSNSTGTGSITKIGSGILTLSGVTNLNSGSLNINQGTVLLSGNNDVNPRGVRNGAALNVNNGGILILGGIGSALGNGSGTVATPTINAGGKMTTVAGTSHNIYAYTLNGGEQAGDPTVEPVSGANYAQHANSTITVSANSLISAPAIAYDSSNGGITTFNVASGVTLTAQQNILNNGTLSRITKTGAGAMVMSGTDNLVLGYNVQNGLAVFTTAASLPSVGALRVNYETGTPQTGGKVVVGGDAANIDTYRTKLAGGYNAGTWNVTTTPVITMSTEASHAIQANHGIAYITGANYLALHGTLTDFYTGYTPTTTDVLLKYTWMGDANLDGKLSASDYTQIDAGFLLGGFDGVTTFGRWKDGDFNYDGVVNFADYALIDAAYAAGQTQILAADEIAAHTAEFGAPYLEALNLALAAAEAPSAVPEPASLGMLALGAVALLRRRR